MKRRRDEGPDLFAPVPPDPPGEGWQSMASAPRTGPVVDVEVWNGREVQLAHWAHGGGEDQPPFGPAWFRKVGKGSSAMFVQVQPEPTHWRHVPAPAVNIAELEAMAVDPTAPVGHVGPPKGKTIAQAFEEFHVANPDIYQLILRFARERKAEGYERCSMQMIFERIRWEVGKQTRNDQFKLNNNYKPLYTRMVMNEHPEEFEGFFQIRVLHAPRRSRA